MQVLQQGFQGTQSEDFIHTSRKALAPGRSSGLQVRNQVLDDGQRWCPVLVPHHRHPLQVHFIQKVAMDVDFSSW